MKTQLRGFFGLARDGQPSYFGGPPSQFYVVELADDGIFFVNSDGSRKPSQCSDNEDVFPGFIESGSWLKFEGGNPFPSSTEVHYVVELWSRNEKLWRHCYRFDAALEAHAEVAESDRRRKWRVVRVTREVLP